MKDYTLQIYKIDKRYKDGEMLMSSYDYIEKDEKWMKEEVAELYNTVYDKKKYRLELHETWVTKKSLMSGKEYQERFDTPDFCSPSSGSYWSM